MLSTLCLSYVQISYLKYHASSIFHIKTQTNLENLFVANQLELNVRIQNVQDEFQIKPVDIYETNEKFLNRKVFNISNAVQRIWVRCSIPCQDWNCRFENPDLKFYVDDRKFDLINKNAIVEERGASKYNKGIMQFGGFETISIDVAVHPCVRVFKIKCEASVDEWRVLPMCNTPRGYESVLQGRLCQPNNGIASGLIEFHQSNFSECVTDTTSTTKTTSVILSSTSNMIENDGGDFYYLLTIIISDLIVAIILLVIGYLIITLIIKIKRIRSRVNDGYFPLQSFV